MRATNLEMNTADLTALLDRLCAEPRESEWLEFKATRLEPQPLGEYRFSQDYVFSSPSTAAAVVLGRSANGRIEWKDAKGHLQALEAGA